MDVRLSEQQELLRQSARDLLIKECPMDTVRRAAAGEAGPARELWGQARGLGWPSLMHSTDCGGAGLGLVELALLLEESGRVLMPGPLLGSAVASLFVARSPNEELRDRHLAALVSGETTTSLATLERAGGWESDQISCLAETEGRGLRLSGTKLFVADSATADRFVVSARSPEGQLTLVLVTGGAEGLAVEAIDYADQSRPLGRVELDAVVAGPEDIIATGKEAEGLLAAVMDVARVAVAAESCGGAAAVLDMSRDYAKTREQFGRPIGSFQAIQHKLADMYVLLESARSAALYAAWAIDHDEAEAHQAACLAKAYCSEAYTHIASEGIQIHGGMGFTWEADLHLYYKRAKASEVAFGDPAWNREQAARSMIK